MFALVIGWLAGDAGVAPGLEKWLTAREVLDARPGPASCSFEGQTFELRQVVIQRPERKVSE